MADLPPLRDYSRSRAVVMGTWDYDFLPRVPAAENSLRRMAGLLTGPLCGWPLERMLQVENELGPGDLPDQLITAFDGISDVALFYYVGHGQVTPDDQLCLGLVRSRCEPNRRAATSLRFSDVRQALADSSAAVKIVILDCCFAGLATKGSLSAAADDVLDMTGGTGAYTMAATGADTTAWYEDSPDLARPQTYFTKYLADLVEHGMPGQPSRLRLDPMFKQLRDNLATARRPVPRSKAIDDAREFAFAYNAAPRDTHRDPEQELAEARRTLAALLRPSAAGGNRWIELRDATVALIDKTVLYVREMARLLPITVYLGEPIPGLNELELQRKLLTQIELQIAFVGVGKAGSSTIVNAITGHSTLRTRAIRSSVIPTRIRLAPDIEDPVLVIDEEDAAVLNRAVTALKRSIDQGRIRLGASQRLTVYPIFMQIRDNDFPPIRTLYTGEEAVSAALGLIQDLVLLAESTSPRMVTRTLKTIPLIISPMASVRGLDALSPLGSLTILDMPGFAETNIPGVAGSYDAAWLASMLDRELRSTDATVIVLDYTLLGSTSHAMDAYPPFGSFAAADVAWTNLFALVNKIDQRRSVHEFGSDEIKRVVRSALDNLGVHQAKVLETSGMWAWLSSAALGALDGHQGSGTEAGKTRLDAFAREVRPFDDDDERDEWLRDRDGVRRVAERLWTKAGLTDVLTEAVEHLNGVVVPATVGSGLARIESMLQSIHARIIYQLRFPGTITQAESRELRQIVGRIRNDFALIAAMRRIAP
jgi:hypothetical protein